VRTLARCAVLVGVKPGYTRPGTPDPPLLLMIRISPRLVLASALALMLAVPAVSPAAKTSPPKQFYVSLGDSYATGYQPTAPGVGSNTRNGFAYKLPALAKPRGYDLQLVNFGCGGATTTSILQAKGCHPRARALGGPSYPNKTQTAAAEAYLRAHRGKVGLITVSIGGNDVTKCLNAADPTACVADAIKPLEANVTKLVKRLRRAAGPNVRIVGITYPDVVLGLWTTGKQSDQDFAKLSLFAFRGLLNPALKKSYESVRKGSFVDVTAATGAYGPLDQTTTLAPYGTIPVPVATVCKLTYFCQFRDIHARTNGYKLIAQLIAKSLPRKT
jgi:lysophospholipase L1-like esterase